MSAGRLRLLSRSDRDMTRAYPELADLARQAGTRELVLDGEIAAFAGGRPSFAALQRRMHVAAPSPRLLAAVPVTYLVFDIMDLDGESLIGEPYAQRRAILEAQQLGSEQVHVPPSFPAAGRPCSRSASATAWRAWWSSASTPPTGPAAAPPTG